jgi:hypothetical protein
MSEATQVILNLLWRFYPIAWLTTVIVRALARITSWLEDEESWVQLSCSKEDCAFVGGWLALAENRLNELIVMKAMKLLKRPYYPPRSCGHHMVRAVRTPQEIYRRLCRLTALYHDHQRLYERRAQKLQRLFEKAGLQLEAIHHPCQTHPSAARRAGCGGGCGEECHFFTAPHPAQRIRAPPQLARNSGIETRPNPLTASARTRDYDSAPITDRRRRDHRALMRSALASHRAGRQLPPASKRATLRGRDS